MILLACLKYMFYSFTLFSDYSCICQSFEGTLYYCFETVDQINIPMIKLLQLGFFLRCNPVFSKLSYQKSSEYRYYLESFCANRSHSSLELSLCLLFRIGFKTYWMITANDESFLFWFNITKHMCHTCLYCSCHSKFSHFCISFATYLRINPKLAVLNFLLKMVHSNRVGDITLSFHCICNTNIRINLASDYNDFLGCFNHLEIFIQLMHNFSEYIYLH